MRRLLDNSISQRSPGSLATVLGIGLLLLAANLPTGCETGTRNDAARINYAIIPKTGMRAAPKPLVDYDKALVRMIEKRWDDLLGKATTKQVAGIVVVKFVLKQDGNISDVGIIRNTADDALAAFCQRAIQDPAPYPPWPEKMRKEIPMGSREIQFTFNYLK